MKPRRRFTFLTLAFVSVAVLAAVGTLASSENWPDRGVKVEAATVAAPVAEVSTRTQARIFSEDVQLSDGATAPLLRMPIGSLRVTCLAGRVKTTFRPARSLASADVVVLSDGGKRDGMLQGRKFSAPRMNGTDIQRWSIAEFAEADVHPTMITVAARSGARGTSYRCAVSAQAVVGAETGTTTW